MLQELGDAYADVLADHHALIRGALEGYGGVEVATQGDSFLAAFRSPSSAVAAAAAAQRALASRRVRVRMGLHTGEPLVAGDNYVGLDVHRAARICEAAHGGQVLLSAETCRLVGASVRDLGEHRLKDLADPVGLFQLVVPGLPERFPVPRSGGELPLPVPATPLVGRERELQNLRELLRQDDVRLLTLVGPGGTGKTRLALELATEAARRSEGAVAFVELASLEDSSLLPATIVRALGEDETGDALEALARRLRERRTLLVLDNLEQLSGAATWIGRLLASVPELRLVATSRSVLRLAGERRYDVPPLPADDAVALFRQRASAAGAETEDGDEPMIRQICARLDGLPLAIELAAARTPVLPPPALMRRLDERLRLLTGGASDAPARQRTLRGAIEWSWELLEPGERTLLARLSIFTGGFSLEAAAAVAHAPLETLQALVDKSLLRSERTREGEPRFLMLETIREFAGEQLEAGEGTASLARRHAQWAVELAESAEQGLSGPEQTAWLGRLDLELENLRAALRWAAENDVDLGLRIAGSPRRFWEARGHSKELRAWLEPALLVDPEARTAGRGKALVAVGRIMVADGEYASASVALELARDLFRELGDDGWTAFALAQLGWILLAEGEYREAERLCEESVELARRRGGAWIRAGTLNNLAGAAIELGDAARGRALLEESLALSRRSGDTRHTANLLANTAWAGMIGGNREGARALLEESLTLVRELDDSGSLPMAVHLLGMEANMAGEEERAEALLHEAFHLAQEFGERHQQGEILAELALAFCGRHPAGAVRLLAASDALLSSMGMTRPPRDRERFDGVWERIAERLPGEEFERAKEAGSRLSPEEAITSARPGQ